MRSFDDIDSTLDELIPQDQETETSTGDKPKLEGTFQILSSLGGYLELYEELTHPGKDKLVDALYERGIRNVSESSVYDFISVGSDQAVGYIRAKDGTWSEHTVTEDPEGQVTGTFQEVSKLASFLDLYERYGFDRPGAKKLREALIHYGVDEVSGESNTYVAPLEGIDGEEYRIGIETGEPTTAYRIDEFGNRIGSEAYTEELLPKLAEDLTEDSESTTSEEVEPFAPPLPEDVENLLEIEEVAENYQVIMHRLAEQASNDVSSETRSQKLAEARFITEVLTGQRTWED
jgi:hypothetical protein